MANYDEHICQAQVVCTQIRILSLQMVSTVNDIEPTVQMKRLQ